VPTEELIILQGHLPEFIRVFFCGIRVAQSSVYRVVCCRSLFVIGPFSFGHYIVCPSIYGF